MRHAFLLCLTILTLVTSVGLGHARGMMPAQDGLVICQGHATSVVWLDSQGNEVEVAVLCPEAALGLLAHGGVLPPETAPITAHAIALEPTLIAGLAQSALPETAQARGPPALL